MADSSLLTCGDIAREIAMTRGQCDRSTVWRAMARLQIKPKHQARIALYTREDLRRVESSLRKPNA